MVKRVLWIILAVGIALAGAWGYGELVRRENDSGQPLRLLAIAEEQSLALSFSRRGRLTTPVPEEIEKLRAQFASVAADERRIEKLVGEGVAPAANLESLQHQREAIAADIRA